MLALTPGVKAQHLSAEAFCPFHPGYGGMSSLREVRGQSCRFSCIVHLEELGDKSNWSCASCWSRGQGPTVASLTSEANSLTLEHPSKKPSYAKY